METVKSVPQLKAGDIVLFHVGTFECLQDAQPVLPGTHEPGVFTCKARCLSGCVPCYYWPGSEWIFQGNDWARHTVTERE